MIPANDEGVAVQHGRTAFAVGVEGVHAAKVFLPFHAAVQVEAIEAARTEKGVEVFTVGDRRIGGEAAGYVTAFVRPLFAQGFRPQHTAIPSADGQSEKLVAMSDWHAVVNAGGIVIDRLLRLANRHRG